MMVIIPIYHMMVITPMYGMYHKYATVMTIYVFLVYW